MPDREPHLPSFVVIGAMKCATSSLHEYLDLHPEIGMARPETGWFKETDFFLTPATFARGPDWYLAQFPSSGKRLRGEASPNYTKRDEYPGVPERMAGMLPDAKLLYLVRDPIARSISHYLHKVAEGWERRPAEIALRPGRPNTYLEPSLYAHQIAAYLDWFPRARLRVLAVEDLKRDPAGTLGAVFGFLGVDPDFSSPRFAQRFHRSDVKIREKLWAHWLRTRVPVLGALVRAVLPEAARRRVTHTGLPEVRPSDQHKAALQAFFAEDQASLAAQTDLVLRPLAGDIRSDRRATA